MELARVGGEADELALRVVRVDTKFLHVLSGLLRLGRHVQEHRLERRARIGAEEASGREGGEAARGFLDAEAGLGGDEASLFQGHAEVANVAHSLTRASGEEVCGVTDIRATELELGERHGCDTGGVSDTEATGGGQVERPLETAVQDVSGRHARLGELFDCPGGFGRAERRVRARLNRSLPELVHVLSGLVRRGLHVAHGLVEIREGLDDVSGCCSRGDTVTDHSGRGGVPGGALKLRGLRQAAHGGLGCLAGGVALRCELVEACRRALDLTVEVGDVCAQGDLN